MKTYPVTLDRCRHPCPVNVIVSHLDSPRYRCLEQKKNKKHQESTMTTYAELVAATNFSFLRGASHPFEMVA